MPRKPNGLPWASTMAPGSSWRSCALACCVAVVAVAVACQQPPTGSGKQQTAASTTGTPTASAAAATLNHDPANPPIDCPLRKAGIDPNGLKPFEDAEKYIAFLERPDRVAWQRPDAVVAALDLAGNETVVDLGAGSGYFTFRLAKAVPTGKVIAIDIEPEMIRHIHHKVMADGIANVEPVLGQPDDPGIPEQADVVFVCDVLHHVPNREAWLGKLVSEMHHKAKLVLVEFKEGPLPEGPPEAMKLGRAKLLALAKGAGLVLASEKPELLPYQTFLVFSRP